MGGWVTVTHPLNGEFGEIGRLFGGIGRFIYLI